MRVNHDDRMRRLRATLAGNGTRREPFPASAKVRLPRNTLRRRTQAQGGVIAFRALVAELGSSP